MTDAGGPVLYYDGECGVCTRSVELVLRHAFVTSRLHRLEANIQPGNLASIALNMYVKVEAGKKPVFDFAKLAEVTKVIVKNLNKIIDVNYYPVPEVSLLLLVILY